MLRKIPNILTVGRILIVPFFVLAFYLPGFYGDLTALVLFIIASFTDFLDGITRRTVIQIAKSKNIKVHERKIKPEELKDFDGCFLTGTAAEVTPVSTIADYQFKVCDLIIDLNESYLALVKKKKAA